MYTKSKLVVLAILMSLSITKSIGQTSERNEKFSLVFGLNQPIVTNGFNVEVNYWIKNFVIDYSHGFGLQFRDNLTTKEAKRQRLQFNIKHSLGIGFGYRITKNFNIRIEPKLHIWDMYYDDQFKSNKITTYNTFTLGLGAYYKWQPFEKQENLLKGLTVVPSFRWWPNVSTTLKDNKYVYANEKTKNIETINANNIGISNTPFFANISIGYTFSTKK